jgi:hypothetical protein
MDAFGWVIAILIAFLLGVLAIKTTVKIIKLIASILVVLVVVGILGLVYLLSGSAPTAEITSINALEKDSTLGMFYYLMTEKSNLSEYNVASFPAHISSYTEEGKIEKSLFGEIITLVTIQTAHRNDLSVHLSLDSYIKKKGILNLFKREKSKEMLETGAADVFLENLEGLTLFYAGIANKTNARYFTPFSELGCVVGDDKAQEWYSSVMPKLKEKYSGNVIEQINCMH